MCQLPGKHKVAWTDVHGFQRGPRFIRVYYNPGCEPPGRGAKATETLGKFGLYFPPSYLSVRYDTRGQGQGLYEILQQRRGRYYVDVWERTHEGIDVATDSPGVER